MVNEQNIVAIDDDDNDDRKEIEPVADILTISERIRRLFPDFNIAANNGVVTQLGRQIAEAFRERYPNQEPMGPNLSDGFSRNMYQNADFIAFIDDFIRERLENL